MKGKFAIGQLVETKEGAFGKVTGVDFSVTSEGTQTLYTVTGQLSKISEDFIVRAYSPVVQRERKVKVKYEEATLAQENEGRN